MRYDNYAVYQLNTCGARSTNSTCKGNDTLMIIYIHAHSGGLPSKAIPG